MDRSKPSASDPRTALPTRCLAIIAGVLTLLLVIPGCAMVNSSVSGASRSTATPGGTAGPGGPAVPSATEEETPENDKPTPTPVPTRGASPTSTPARVFTSTPTATHAPAATPTPGKPSIHEVAQTTTIYGGNTGPATVTCPSGERALGGGWNAPPQNARIFSATLSGNTWAVSVVPLGHPATTVVTAYVECLRNAPAATVTPRSQALSMPASSFNGGTVGCASGETLVGWGFSFGATSSIELTSTHPELVGWSLEFVNHGVADLTGSLIAVCLSNITVSVDKEHSAGVNVPTGATGANQVSCVHGVAASGGFQYSSGGGGNLYLLHAISTGWQAAAYAETTSIYFNVWAMCLFFQ